MRLRSSLVTFGALVACVLVFAPLAAAATAPTATTGPVTTVGPTTATVTGSVNPNGTATSWHFEYGTSTAYGSQTTAHNAGSGTTAGAASENLTGLKAGTTYHYRLVATNSAGTSRGADAILTTSSAPVAVTGSASAIAPTSATLNGSVNPEGRDTTWYVEYGRSTSYGSKTTVRDAGAGTSAVAVAAPVTGLQTGTLYHFRVVATSDAGTSHGADATFTPASAPAVVTKPASSITDTGARLNGTVVPNGEATTAYFEYGTTTSYGTKSASQSAGSGSSTANISIAVALKPATTYHFRLVATSAAGTGTGADMTVVTSGPPVVITGSAAGISTTAATLTGSVDPAGHSTSWFFQYGTTMGYGGTTPAHSAGSAHGAKAVTAAVTGLSFGTTYHFRLVAKSSAGTIAGADMAFTTAGQGPEISASPRIVVFGHRAMLSGTVASKQPNQQVVVYQKRFGAVSFTSVATTLTGAGGVWQLSVRPSIRTTYKAMWMGTPSSTVTVGVRPAVSLRVQSGGGRLATHVAPTAAFQGRIVQLQRRRGDGRWITIARKQLNGASNVVFHPRLPHGRSTLRIKVSAAPGYLAGSSRTVTVRR